LKSLIRLILVLDPLSPVSAATSPDNKVCSPFIFILRLRCSWFWVRMEDLEGSLVIESCWEVSFFLRKQSTLEYIYLFTAHTCDLKSLYVLQASKVLVHFPCWQQSILCFCLYILSMPQTLILSLTTVLMWYIHEDIMYI